MARPRCAACKVERRRCTNECFLAPYFPANDPDKYARVHRIFGAHNIRNIINSLPVDERAEGVRTLIHEAASQVHDHVNSCTSHVFLLEQELTHLQQRLAKARTELVAYLHLEMGSSYLASQGIPPLHFMNSQMLEMPNGRSLVIREPNQQLQPHGRSQAIRGPNQQLQPHGKLPVLREPNQQLQPHGQLPVIREPNQQLQLQPHQLMVSDTQRISSMLMHRGDQAGYQGFDMNNGMVTAGGFNQTNITIGGGGGSGGGGTPPVPSPFALGSFVDSSNRHRPGQTQQLIQTDLMLQPSVLQEQRQRQRQLALQQQPELEPWPQVLLEGRGLPMPTTPRSEVGSN